MSSERLNEYYNLGSNREKAQQALDWLNDNFFPRSGYDSQGNEVLNATMCWIKNLIECLDGNFRIPRIPPDRLQPLLDSGEVTQEHVQYFLNTYVEAVEEFNSDWF